MASTIWTYEKETAKKRIDEIIPDIVRLEDAIEEMNRRIAEHAKFDYEKPEGSLPHLCSECGYWKRLRRGYRTMRNGLLDEKRRCEKSLEQGT